MKKQKFKFDLLENARDSLSHAVEHLTKADSPSGKDLKRIILDVSHVVELILKERLRKIHPAFIWVNIDKFPSSSSQIVGTEKAINRLLNLEGIALPEESIKTLRICRKIRNSIEHFEFEIEIKKARIVVGRMLSFIFSFAKYHLGLDWENDFKKDRKWNALLSIYEFWEAHSETLEKQLMEDGEDICECPSCGAFTYNLSTPECALCGHFEERVICENCNEEFWESETETFEGVDGDESGVYEFRFTTCRNCLEKQIAEDAALELAAESLKEK